LFCKKYPSLGLEFHGQIFNELFMQRCGNIAKQSKTGSLTTTFVAVYLHEMKISAAQRTHLNDELPNVNVG